ncbi:hypothetical protein F511_18644 [Dorcoceras hygrometricum]|uniref:Bifunctional inhibitor/plant lipid transfer protein/seed storage helical domain-containing protein n=1 Tax=Dorcoceras hygrometricum TaxID=472368 RepID=A0A2Z7DFV0_9LAMI|nr:hypothetical protein F511_18644 [Dorcoceras hygrometricum]
MDFSHRKFAILSMLFTVFCLGANINVLELADAQMLCNMTFEGLMACQPAAVAPIPPTPSTTCCSALSHANTSCLCSFKNSKMLPSLGIDPTLAMQLPEKCKLTHPAQC